MSIALYVHFPFCLSICPYCDFDRQATGFDRIGTYVECVLRELRRYAGAVGAGILWRLCRWSCTSTFRFACRSVPIATSIVRRRASTASARTSSACCASSGATRARSALAYCGGCVAGAVRPLSVLPVDLSLLRLRSSGDGLRPHRHVRRVRAARAPALRGRGRRWHTVAAVSLELYVHFPFCLSICPYCDFDRQATGFDRIGTYVECVLRELRRYAGAVGAGILWRLCRWSCTSTFRFACRSVPIATSIVRRRASTASARTSSACCASSGATRARSALAYCGGCVAGAVRPLSVLPVDLSLLRLRSSGDGLR